VSWSPSTPAERGAEVALLGLSLVTAVAFCRLFDGWSWLATLLLTVLASHLVAIVCRRFGLGLLLSAVASTAALIAFATLRFYRASATFAIIPTRTTWRLAGDDLAAAWDSFATAKALVRPDAGYVLASVVALWLAAWLADGFAFRAGVRLESLAPMGIIFVFGAALAADRNRLVLTGMWVLAAALFVALHRALDDEAGGWLSTSQRSVAMGAVRVAVGLALVAAVGAAVVAPRLPGAGAQPLIDPSPSRGSGDRNVFSPFVDIKGRIVNRSNVEAFRVQSPVASYWRLTALDRFDGSEWSSELRFRTANQNLTGGFVNDDVTTSVEQTFTIENLAADWLPSAYAPRRLSGPGRDVRFDSATASLFVDDGTQEGDTYSVVSAVPEKLTPAAFDAATGDIPASVRTRYLDLPDDFPKELRDLAASITKDSATPYKQALALQNYFHANGFSYSLDVPRGQSTNAIEVFLKRKTGYCEQYAGTMAALARAVGLPSRVAVGFTAGVRQPDGSFVVQGKHAHAWPEVYIAGVGWVLFEPTPTRGAPEAEQYTGIAAAQAGEPATRPNVDLGATPTTTTAPSGGGGTNETVPDVLLPPIGNLDEGGRGGAATGTNPDPGLPFWLKAIVVLLVAAAVAGAWLLIIPVLVRRRWERRRARATSVGERVLLSWHEAASVLDRAGVGPDPSETPFEYARRVRGDHRVDASALARLAELTTAGAYAPADSAEADAKEAEALRHEIDRHVWNRANWQRRLRWLADPRPLLDQLPAVHSPDRPAAKPEPLVEVGT